MKWYTFEDDGMFHMCFEDFVKYFNRLYVLHLQLNEPKRMLHGKWEHGNAEGSHNNPYWYRNPRYAIKTTEPDTTILVNLSQYDLRYRHSLNIKQVQEQGGDNYIGMYLLEKTKVDYKTMQVRKVTKQTDFTDTRDTSLEHQFKGPSTHVILPCTLDPNKETSYTIAVYSNKYVELEEIKQSKQHSIQGVWKGILMTDSIKGKHSTTYGPMYSFKSNKAGNVDILLVAKQEKEIVIGIKVYESVENGQFTRVLEYRLESRSMCVSLDAKDLEYVIAVLTHTPTDSDIEFELVVYSDNVSNLRKYVTQMACL